MTTSMIAAIALAAAATGAGDEGIELRLRLTPGQTFRHEGTFAQKMDCTMPDGTTMPGMMVTTGSGLTIVRVLGAGEDGSYRCEMRVERFKATTRTPMMQFEYDSANPADAAKESSLIGKFWSLFSTTTFTATVGPHGELRSTGGMEKIRAALLEQFPETGATVEAMCGQGVSRSLWLGVFARLPKGRTRPGDTWTITNDAMGIATAKTTYRLRGVEDGKVLVEPAAVDIIFGRSGGQPANPLAAMATNVKAGKSESSGLSRFDAGTGVLVDCTDRLVMEYSMDIQGKKVRYRLVQSAESRQLPARTGARAGP